LYTWTYIRRQKKKRNWFPASAGVLPWPFFRFSFFYRCFFALVRNVHKIKKKKKMRREKKYIYFVYNIYIYIYVYTEGTVERRGTRVGRIWKFVRTPKICRARSLIILLSLQQWDRRHGRESEFIAFINIATRSRVWVYSIYIYTIVLQYTKMFDDHHIT